MENVLFDEYIEPEDFVKLINKAVKPIRKAIKNINNKFSWSLVQNYQQKFMTTELITL